MLNDLCFDPSKSEVIKKIVSSLDKTPSYSTIVTKPST